MFYQRYNFVFLLPCNADYYNVIFYDLNNCANVRIINMQGIFTRSGQLQVKFEPVHSDANLYTFREPIENLAFGNYFQKEFGNSNPIIFFIFAEFYNWMKAIGYFDYLRHNYPNCKLVLYLTNPIHTYQKYANIFINEKSVREIRSEFDCILTYNKFDEINFGFTFFCGAYSILPFERQPEIYDIFFIGVAKDRLDKIHAYYEYFKGNGFKCNFYVTDVPDELQKFPKLIHYNKRLSYLEVLNHVIHSKGILEVAQGGNYGLTLRYFEALVYDKNFITDNGIFSDEKFASPKLFYIPPYSKFNIDREKYLAVAKLSNNYKNQYSPVRYLEFLESLFNQRV